MGPPGGGRNPVTARLLRHFHYIGFTELQATSKVFTLKSLFDRLIYGEGCEREDYYYLDFFFTRCKFLGQFSSRGLYRLKI